MNIFVLDEDPVKCAQMHCDKHVVKMILESAQMICTTHHLCPNKYVDYEIRYKQTHMNHPCAKWLRDSKNNYYWFIKFITALNEEYKYRYNHTVNHKSFDAIKDLPIPNLPDKPRTLWARAMPDECKVGKDIIASYRQYYIKEKMYMISYRKRKQPDWLPAV